MPKLSKTGCILLVVFLVFAATVRFWCIDIGSSAMVTQARLNGNLDGVTVEASNGFWVRSPIDQYHLGMALSILPVLALAFISVRAIHNEIPKGGVTK